VIDEALTMPGCVGFKLYPPAGWTITDPGHAWVLDRAADEGLPVVVHTASMGGDPIDTTLSRPAAINAALVTHPKLTWVMAHAGFDAWWLEAIDLAAGWQRVFLDISLWQGCARRDYGAFRYRMAIAAERVGAHRIMFGSDIFRGPGSDVDGAELRQWIDWCVALSAPYSGEPPVLSTDQLELLMAGNADRVYQERGRP
jgi:predicted TIM-barrel fold metal-dependent hydrolase